MSIRVAVIGLGIGKEHLKAYLDSGICEIAAVSDLNRDLALQTLSEQGLSCPVRSFEEIVSDPNIDVVSIASFDADHAHQVLSALKAGKHVFVEKPLCKTKPELVEIHRAWKSARTHLRSNLVLRNAPLYSWLSDSVKSGDFGDLFSVDADYLYGRIEKITGGWRSRDPNYSVMAGGGIHMLDLVLRITGQRPVSVSSRGNSIGTRGTAFQLNDFVSSSLMFDSGLIARVNANFACVHPHQHALRLFGTRATAIIDDQGPRIFRHRGDDKKSEPIDRSSRYGSKGVLIPEFVRAIKEQADPAAALYQELDLLSVVVAIDQAQASGIEVKVEYLR
jgi:predicted dehydrogenase